MSLSFRVWLLIGVLIAGVLAVVIYFSIHLALVPKLHSLTVDNNATRFTCGDTLTLAFTGSNVKQANWSYSTNGGTSFTPITSNVASPSIQWTLPSTLFSSSCVVRVAVSASPTKYFLDSGTFSVVPHFAITVGEHPGQSFLLPKSLRITFETNSALITNDNLTLLTSTDGVVFQAPTDADTYQPSVDQSFVQWRASNDLAGSKLFLKLATQGLTTQGYSSELEAITINPVNFTTNASSGSKSVGDVFLAFNVYEDSRYTSIVTSSDASWLIFNETIYMKFDLAEGSDPLTSDDVSFEYSLEGGLTWIPMDHVIDAAEPNILHEYSWTIPSTYGNGSQRISFRVTQTNAVVLPKPTASVNDINIDTFLHVTQDGEVDNHNNVMLQFSVISSSLVSEDNYGSDWTLTLTYNNDIPTVTLLQSDHVFVLSTQCYGSRLDFTLTELPNSPNVSGLTMVHNKGGQTGAETSTGPLVVVPV